MASASLTSTPISMRRRTSLTMRSLTAAARRVSPGRRSTTCSSSGLQATPASASSRASFATSAICSSQRVINDCRRNFFNALLTMGLFAVIALEGSIAAMRAAASSPLAKSKGVRSATERCPASARASTSIATRVMSPLHAASKSGVSPRTSGSLGSARASRRRRVSVMRCSRTATPSSDSPGKTIFQSPLFLFASRALRAAVGSMSWPNTG
mmetsp:Transcript_128461/g.273959  ORF Transcript_128461/g.273959 Transcript_128461/m.273959 type:complete len:212 (+) Transcript_128461:2630-3265(+)